MPVTARSTTISKTQEANTLVRTKSVLAEALRAIAGASIVGLLIVSLAVAPTFAGRGGGGGGGGKPSGGTGTISLVLLNSTDGTAHYGQQVDFVVSTTATDKPYVRLNCYERGVWVMTDSTGYYPDYPWPGHIFTLRWDPYHLAGAEADCTATLYYYTRKGTATLVSKSFHVYP
jgi:hypothetical protein